MQRHRVRFRELGFFVKANRLADHVMATLDQKRLLTIRDEEVVKPDRRLIDFKYFNIRPWIVENIIRTFRLGLDDRRSARILDLGTGFGYFPYVCEFMENNAQALDIDGHRLYDRIIEALGVNRRHHWIRPFEPLPESGSRFDNVTAFQIAFNRPGTTHEWGPDEWAFFIDDLLENQLVPGGHVHLELNWSHRLDAWYDPSCERVFKRYNARCRGNEIDIYKS